MSLPFFLGTVRISGPQAQETLDAYYELGGRDIDTARGYPNSEAVIGEWSKSRGVNDLRIETKGGHPDHETWSSRLGSADVDHDLNTSLETLGVGQVESFLLHRDDPETPTQEIAETLSAIVSSGRAKTIGVSNWSADRARKLAEALAAIGGPQLTWVSNAFGLAAISGPSPFRGVETAEPALRDVGRLHGFRILAWSAMSQGFFVGGRGATSPIFDVPENQRRRSVLESVASDHSAQPVEVLARWTVIGNDDVVPVLGPTGRDHVQELAAATTNMGLDAAVRDLIARLGPAAHDTGAFR